MFHLRIWGVWTVSCPPPSHVRYSLVGREFKSPPIFHTFPILKYGSFRKWPFIICEPSTWMLHIFIFIRTLSRCFVCMVFLRKGLSTGPWRGKGNIYRVVRKGVRKACFWRLYKTVKQVSSIPLGCLSYKLGLLGFSMLSWLFKKYACLG